MSDDRLPRGLLVGEVVAGAFGGGVLTALGWFLASGLARAVGLPFPATVSAVGAAVVLLGAALGVRFRLGWARRERAGAP